MRSINSSSVNSSRPPDVKLLSVVKPSPLTSPKYLGNPFSCPLLVEGQGRPCSSWLYSKYRTGPPSGGKLTCHPYTGLLKKLDCLKRSIIPRLPFSARTLRTCLITV